MSIIRAYTIPSNGTVATFHRVTLLTVDVLNGVTLQLDSWSSKESYDAGGQLMWRDQHALPVSQLGNETPIQDAEDWLITDDGPLSGGSLVPVSDDPLDLAKTIKWAQMKVVRSQREQEGFMVEGIGKFDSDANSRAAIDRAAVTALADPNYGEEWTLADNTKVTLDAAAILKVQAALAGFMGQIHATSQDMRAAINIATSQAQLDIMIWPVTV